MLVSAYGPVSEKSEWEIRQYWNDVHYFKIVDWFKYLRL